jgi:biotin transport system substrate-specific component
MMEVIRMRAQTGSVVLVDALIPRRTIDSIITRYLTDAALMFGFAWFVALSAQIAVRLPWTTVPVTGQTFAVLVTGGALGARRGAGALILYAIMGILAIPVFAPGTGALGMTGEWGFHFIFPWIGTSGDIWNLSSGGYIVGFVFAAYFVGHFAERAWDRKPWSILVMLGSNALVYIPGLLWLFYLIASGWVPPGASQPISEFIAGNGTLDKTLKGGLYPFIAGDLMKIYLATVTLPLAWALVNRFKRSDE